MPLKEKTRKENKVKKPTILCPLHRGRVVLFLLGVLVVSILVAAYNAYNVSIVAEALT